ncbi:MAG TPA: VOC family protein [Longimicrobium sp.]|nr:VOC family protein [Longimicrobium sp.]
MIQGLHVTYYTRHADEMRAFLRDKLGLAFTDAGGGWLIFDVPASEIAAHPVGEGDEAEGGETASGEGNAKEGGVPEISFYCDDLEATMAEMRAKGVEFTSEVSDEGWGRLVSFRVTPDVELDLYQPAYARHPAHG